jgi:hypothetical protein
MGAKKRRKGGKSIEIISSDPASDNDFHFSKSHKEKRELPQMMRDSIKMEISNPPFMGIA